MEGAAYEIKGISDLKSIIAPVENGIMIQWQKKKGG